MKRDSDAFAVASMARKSDESSFMELFTKFGREKTMRFFGTMVQLINGQRQLRDKSLLRAFHRWRFQANQIDLLTKYDMLPFDLQGDTIEAKPEQFMGQFRVMTLRLSETNKRLTAVQDENRTLKYQMLGRALQRFFRSVEPCSVGFNRWKHATIDAKNKKAEAKELMRQQVAVQQFESEQATLKEAKENSAKLANMLLCTIYYFKWKLQNQRRTVAEETKNLQRQKCMIKNELKAARSVVEQINRVENEALQTALRRGEEIASDLLKLRELTQKVSEQL